ncbi:mannosylglucosyl-3-phosphoglycerate phosphatase isoform X2 [Adelges cooleyi]|nr:mannosylglucosyl-3-phosphoglycerate phosphatase isoform X2 [Adelges cooleyi]XP_050442425.1 mannosylglucosyl-3-phosphoglycerate phosphatase isoform X2 [Adelges cooleyi]XP_050442435.1 mannosylglucosyl-3-phosphoglycerate phosphatase isoform X2 [Adelges cooleyi]
MATKSSLRSKWDEFVDSTAVSSVELPSSSQVSTGVRNVVGWLKQASLEVQHASLRTLSTMTDQMSGSTPPLVILHFNDVYNVEARDQEPCGGASRFSTMIKSFAHLQPMILFSGDVFSPSMLSTFTKGEQMSKVLNNLGTQCAVYGNHEFDFGLEVLAERVSETNFPWLMSNVVDNETGRPLGDGKITHVFDWHNRRIGLVGLVERDWLDTLATIDPEEVTFIDFVEAGRSLAKQLREDGCDYIIALTHMRMPNDVKLAENVSEIDLILGGHDHAYDVQKINDRFIVKSGTDFREFSKITINLEGSNDAVEIQRIEVTKDIKEDVVMKEILDSYLGVMEGKMGEVLGTFHVELDGRFSQIRTSETNLGNWVCDVLLAATGADLVMLNSGTFRSDRIHPPGDFTLGDLVNIVPMQDPTIVIQVTGQQILGALENGVSKYPKTEGRFLQVSGISFGFDPEAEPGSRIEPNLVKIGDEYLIPNQSYRLATKCYLHNGCDGYTVLKNSPVVINEEECPELSLAIQNHFAAIKMRQGKSHRFSKHRQSLVTLSRRHSLVKSMEGNEWEGGPSPLRRGSLTSPSLSIHHHGYSHSPSPPSSGHHFHHHHHKLNRRASFDDLEQQTCQLSPKLQNRIIKLNAQLRREMLADRQRLEAESVIQEVDELNSSPQGSFDQS